MHDLARLQAEWDEEALARTAVRRARLALDQVRTLGAVTFVLLTLPPLLIIANSLVAGLVAASWGVTS